MKEKGESSKLSLEERTELIKQQIFPFNSSLYTPVGVEQHNMRSERDPTHALYIQGCGRDGVADGNRQEVSIFLPQYDISIEGGVLYFLNKTDHSTSYHHTMDGMRVSGSNGFFYAEELKICLIAYAMHLDNENCGENHDIGKYVRESLK